MPPFPTNILFRGNGSKGISTNRIMDKVEGDNLIRKGCAFKRYSYLHFIPTMRTFLKLLFAADLLLNEFLDFRLTDVKRIDYGRYLWDPHAGYRRG